MLFITYLKNYHMTNLTIVADIKANPAQSERVRIELEKLIPITRVESGCIQYDLHQDNADPSHFLFYVCTTRYA